MWIARWAFIAIVGIITLILITDGFDLFNLPTYLYNKYCQYVLMLKWVDSNSTVIDIVLKEQMIIFNVCYAEGLVQIVDFSGLDEFKDFKYWRYQFTDDDKLILKCGTRVHEVNVDTWQSPWEIDMGKAFKSMYKHLADIEFEKAFLNG